MQYYINQTFCSYSFSLLYFIVRNFSRVFLLFKNYVPFFNSLVCDETFFAIKSKQVFKHSADFAQFAHFVAVHLVTVMAMFYGMQNMFNRVGQNICAKFISDFNLPLLQPTFKSPGTLVCELYFSIHTQ